MTTITLRPGSVAAVIRGCRCRYAFVVRDGVRSLDLVVHPECPLHGAPEGR